jgi:probable rRNA maturation factor
MPATSHTPTIHFDIENPLNLNTPSHENFTAWAEIVLSHEKISTAEISCYITNKIEIQTINNQYRKQNKPTNILSFPFDAPPGLPQDTHAHFLGDLIICPDIIEQEAFNQKKVCLHHWAHITIHGILHLLGYDHVQDNDAEIMEALEIKLLLQLSINDPYRE